MYNIYVSSTVYSIQSKGPLSHFFNDYPVFLNENCCRNPPPLLSPSSCCCYCACYAFPTHKVPIGPSISYGSRQSTLLQRPSSRKLVFGGGNRFYYGLNRDCHEFPCFIRGSRLCHENERRRRGRCCVISESNCGFHQSNNGYGDVEESADAMISLIGEECFGNQEKNRSSKRVVVGNQGSFQGQEMCLSSSDRVELERMKGRRAKKNNLRSFEKISIDKKGASLNRERYGGATAKLGRLNSTGKNVGSISVELKKDELRKNEGRLTYSKGHSQSLRKEGSSCSSYYSVSSTGDVENDTEIKDKNVQFVESSSGYNYGYSSDVGERLDRQDKEEFEIQGDNEERREGEAVLGDARAVGHLKNSEKKTSELSKRVTSSLRDTSEMNLRLSRTIESNNETTTSSKKLIDMEEKLKMTVASNELLQQCVEVEGNMVVNEPKISCNNTESVSTSKIRNNSRNENLESDTNLIPESNNEHKKTVSPGLKAKNSRSTSLSLQMVGFSEDKKKEIKRSSSQSGMSDAMTNTGESTNVVTSAQRVGETDARQNFLHLGVLSITKDSNTNISVSRSETKTKIEEQSAVVNTSNPVARDKKSQTDQKASQKILPRKGFEDATSIFTGQHTGKLSATHSQKVLESRFIEEEINTSLMEITAKETKRRHSQNSDLVVQTESRKESGNHVEKLEVQGSINLSSQTGLQGVGVDREENGSSEARLMPPPSQLVVRDSSLVDLTGEMGRQVISSGTSGSSSASAYMQPGGSPALHHNFHRESRVNENTEEPLYLTADDTLGSAGRLEMSSSQFVGEFFKQSRDELKISEIQKKENTSETDFVREVKKYKQKSIGSVDNQTEDHDSRLSSRNSGIKGPSDEMWHVTDPSSNLPLKAENLEISVDENVTVKRSERSMWNIISDIVHLRWSSRAETSDSALTLRSGERTSPNESVSNETWFSGHEHEETGNTKMERTTASEFTSSDQLEQPSPPAPSQNVSGVKRSKSMYCEVDRPSSSNIMESNGSGGNLLVSGEEYSRKFGKKLEIFSSGLGREQSILPLPPQLPLQSIKGSPIVEEISHDSDKDILASSSTGQLEHPHGATLPEISAAATKDGELKQRRLQRNKQVLRDRFDEWEEACILETEQRKTDEMFMREALAEAKKAADTWEVPVGAVLVKDGKIIARGCNLVEELRDSTAHAEMICIREASKLLKSWRLAETTLYVTLEPCPMCAGAILQSRIDNLVWGAPNKLLGADGSWIRLFPDGVEGNMSEMSDKAAAPVHPFHPKMKIRRGVLGSECADVMQQFFQLRRRKKEKKENSPPLTIVHHNHPSKFLSKMHNVFHLLFCL